MRTVSLVTLRPANTKENGVWCHIHFFPPVHPQSSWSFYFNNLLSVSSYSLKNLCFLSLELLTFTIFDWETCFLSTDRLKTPGLLLFCSNSFGTKHEKGHMWKWSERNRECILLVGWQLTGVFESLFGSAEFTEEHFVLIHLKLHLNAVLTLCALGNVSAPSIKNTIIHFQDHSALIEHVCYINFPTPLRTPAYLYDGSARGGGGPPAAFTKGRIQRFQIKMADKWPYTAKESREGQEWGKLVSMT